MNRCGRDDEYCELNACGACLGLDHGDVVQGYRHDSGEVHTLGIVIGRRAFALTDLVFGFLRSLDPNVAHGEVIDDAVVQLAEQDRYAVLRAAAGETHK